MAKLTEEQIERLREHWYKNSKHIHISPDGKVILSDTPTDNWWCIAKDYLHFNGSPNSGLVIGVLPSEMKELIRKLFKSGNTTIIEIYYALNGGYRR